MSIKEHIDMLIASGISKKDAIKEASVDELKQVKGISEKNAKDIFDYFHI